MGSEESFSMKPLTSMLQLLVRAVLVEPALMSYHALNAFQRGLL